MTTSTGMLGLPGNLAYAAAKAGMVGMTRNMRLSGLEHGIKINLIAPAAVTRMGADPASNPDPADAPPMMSPDLVAPMVAYLAHESCPVSGEIYAAGAGRFSRVFIAATDGYVQHDRTPTIEDVAENWSTINDETSYYVPIDLAAWAADFMKHMSPQGAAPAAT